ncbi:hypothetical protein [Pseudactinotalea sp. HY158]|uniref:hypothetical protein n=1 Tax=Pseudactinotalea sp. HY158 TaxID=2654547 RepID=UPI00129D0622|nr:hypothetical protein [Pseudactinotalea sp. HY158]QGH69413.1 hypothetical protein GCE65_07695 [Pseudactinotalea sp. HY158]
MNSTADPMDLLERMRPGPQGDRAALARIRASLDEAIIRDDGVSTGPRRRPTGTRRGRGGESGRGRWLGAAAAVAVGALILAPALRPTPAQAATPPMLTYSASAIGSVADGSAPSGAPVAADLAAVAAATPVAEHAGDVSLVESAYWALEAVHEDERTRLVVAPVERRTWASTTDGSMRFREVRGTALSRDGSTSLPDVDLSGPALLDYELPADHDAGVLRADRLPRDPGPLLEAVSHARGPHTCDLGVAAARIDCLADALAMMVRTRPVPPDLLAAFWNSLARQDDLYSLGTTTDRLGRDGVTLAYLSPETGTVSVLIADPVTGALLGTEGVDLTGAATGSESPAVFWLEAFEPARWVGGLDES